MYTISDLVIYPIKALPGVHVKQGVALERGLTHPKLQAVRDRAFMVVDGATGKFISLRTHAKALSKISITLDEEAGTLDLAARDTPGVDVLRIDVSGSRQPPAEEQLRSKVWEWEGQASVVDRAWFSKVLGQEVALVQCLEDMDRPVDPDYAPDEQQTGFSDGFPYLFAFEESVKDLFQDAYGSAARGMMVRFRANVVLSGGEPWQEDGVRQLTCSGSDVSFALCKPCSRCTVPAIDPDSGEVDPLVSELLRSKRSGSVLGWTEGPRGFKHSTFFGVNACVIADDGARQGLMVAVGDNMVERGLPPGVIKSKS